jgi:uncharacterized phage-associated protein
MNKDITQYDSVYVARYLIKRCFDEKIQDVGNTKINKLLYLVYGFFLAIYDSEIITERPKYFPYGPVFPRVFRNFDNLITFDLTYNFNENFEKVVNYVIKYFSRISAGKLSSWSHENGSPWDRMKQRNASFGDELLVQEVKEYFKNLLYKEKNGD